MVVSVFLSSAKAAVPRIRERPIIRDVIFFMGISFVTIASAVIISGFHEGLVKRRLNSIHVF